MNKYILLAFYVIILFAFPVLNAQGDYSEGYIVSNEGDTIHGYIQDLGNYYNSKKCLFKKKPDQPSRLYLPGEISEYRFKNGNYYVSRVIEIDNKKQSIFLEFILNGAANLYFFRDLDGSHYLIKKEDGEFLELTENFNVIESNGKTMMHNDRRYIGLLTAYFADCPELHDDIRKSDLKMKSMIKLAESYHEITCPDMICEIYMKKKELPAFYIAPEIGWRYAWINNISRTIPGNPLTLRSNGPVYGIGAGMKLPFISKNTLVRFKVLFGNDYFYETKHVSNSIFPNKYYYYHINSYFSESALIIEQALTTKKLKPYIGIGPSLYYELYSDHKTILEIERNDQITTSIRNIFHYPQSFLGLQINAGLRIDSERKDYFTVGCSYTLFLELANDPTNYLNSNNFTISWFF